jgi:hypothetical protein
MLIKKKPLLFPSIIQPFFNEKILRLECINLTNHKTSNKVKTIPTTTRQRPKISQARPLKVRASQASSCNLYFFFLYTHINLSIIELIVPYGACFFKRIPTTSQAHQLAMENMVYT